MSVSLRAALLICFVSGCSGDDGGPPPDFPADYRATYQEVRGCRLSLEHGLVYMKVLADPDAFTPYTGRTAPFPTGAVVLKEQYGEDDQLCTGPVIQFTVMTKLDVGTAAPALDWSWQRVSADRRVMPDETPRCASCHTMCGSPPDGYDGTCTVP